VHGRNQIVDRHSPIAAAVGRRAVGDRRGAERDVHGANQIVDRHLAFSAAIGDAGVTWTRRRTHHHHREQQARATPEDRSHARPLSQVKRHR
jgi:hypothetical protein